MKVSVNLYYNKSKTVGNRIKLDGVVTIRAGLEALAAIIKHTTYNAATRAEIVITKKARRSEKNK